MTQGVWAAWSTTAASNGSADSSINFSEGQAPSSVNDSARALMARTKEYAKDVAGITLAGTSTAYTATSSTVFPSLALMDGAKIVIIPNVTSGAAPTLAVDGLTAKPIRLATGVVPPTGCLLAGTPYAVTYSNANNEFVAHGGIAVQPSGTAVAATIAFTQSPALLGRYTASAGNGQEITLGSGISMSGAGVLSAASSAGVTMINGTIVESNATNAATFALKTLAGTDPSATDPVYFVFRNATAATGNYVVRSVTAALSVVIPAGGTMGFTSNTAGKLWIIAIDNAGTVELAVGNCLSGTNIYPLGQFPIISTTIMNTSSDNAHVFYSTTARASVPYAVIGYAEYSGASVIVTAGTWNVDPLRLQLYGPGVPLPGAAIQTQRNFTGALGTGGTAVPFDDTIPQISEGDQYMSQAITPTSAANILEVLHTGTYTSSGSVNVAVSLYQDSAVDSLATSWFLNNGGGNPQTLPLSWAQRAGTVAAITFKIFAGGSSGTVSFNGTAGARKFGGALASSLSVREVMA